MRMSFGRSFTWLVVLVFGMNVCVNASTLGEKVVNTFFNNVFSSLLGSGDGFSAIFDPATTYIQFSTVGVPIDPTSFNNLRSVANPRGDPKQSEYFSQMVNSISGVSNIEDAYKGIIGSARPLPDNDASKRAIYERAWNYLHVNTTLKDFEGNVISQEITDSPIYALYNKKQSAYTQAVSTYRLAALKYNMSNIDDQDKWQALSPVLINNVNQAFDEYRSVAPAVESALNALKTMGDSLATTTIAKCVNVLAQTELDSVLTTAGTKYHMSFPQPFNWATNGDLYSQVEISSDNVLTTDSASYSSWSAGGGFGGFFGFSVSAGGQRTETHHHTDATHITIDAQIALVKIERPWLLDSLFKLRGWSLEHEPSGRVSHGSKGDVNGQLLPAYPTHFIVVKDVNLSGDWSVEDRTLITSHTQVNSRIHFGPFTVGGGSYSFDSRKGTFSSSVTGENIHIPGLQIIGWVNTIVPFSPQLDGTGSRR